MKAWVWEGDGRLGLVKDYPAPVARPGWVVLKVRAAVDLVDRHSDGFIKAVLVPETAGAN